MGTPRGPDRFAQRARVVTAPVGEVALSRAVLEAHPTLVDLAMVGVGVTEVEDVAARPQGGEKVCARQRGHRRRLSDCGGGREQAQRERSGA